MRYLKKILFYLMIILTFTISFSNEENRITIYERENEPAKLKIGVTKMITKELAMDFDAEKKIIYCEVPEEVTENDSIYVSETLDEIPSTSTTNGRKTINNINKYLTKDVKANANFNYKVVDVNDEVTGEVKKYLVINCKNPVSSVYLYIVENGTYKIKGLYRGVFKQLLDERSLTEYGTIYIKDNFLSKNYREIYYDGNSINVKKIAEDGDIDEEASKKIELIGNYPKKIESGKKYYAGINNYPFYKIEIYNKGSFVKETEPKRLDGKNDNLINTEIKINGITNEDTKIYLETTNESDYYNIWLSQEYPYNEVDYDIKVIYGNAGLAGNHFEGLDTDTFALKIAPKSLSELPESTEGSVHVKNIYKTQASKDTLLSFSNETTATLSNESILKYERFMGKAPEILDISNVEYMKNFPAENKNVLRITYENNGSEGKKKTWTKEYELNGKNIINLENMNLTGMVHNTNGTELGEITIKGKGETNKKKYYEVQFNAVPTSGSYWESNEYRQGAFTLNFEYVTRTSTKTETILKTDKLNIIVNPLDEKLAPETRGTLLITNSIGLPGHDLYLKGGKIEAKSNIKGTLDWSYDPNGIVSVTGKLPTGFPSNDKEDGSKYWVNMEKGYRLVIKNESHHQVIETTGVDVGTNDKKTPFNYKTGDFRSVWPFRDGWVMLYSDSGKNIGRIYFSYRDNSKDSITIGFRFHYSQYPEQQEKDFEWRRGDRGAVNKYAFEYQVKVGDGDNDWETIKTDILEIIIQPGLDLESPKITLNNPLVYYDYDSSSAISNIVHNRRAHISSEAPKTLNKNGSNFIKNIDLDGKEWIETTDTKDYTYLKKHKVSIVRGTDEVLKNTDENGRTLSSTYLSGDNSIKGNKNKIMFSYDGGNKYLNFGVSKYNFERETIKDVVISHFDDGETYLEERKVYEIEIPRFEGIHYMGNYDIKPRQSYTKNYEYNQNLSNKEPVIIDYGTIGFRNLDTRITEQSGGEGINFRATRKVKLVSEDGTYVIKGAELYFEKDESDDNNETTLFKGENEKATSAMLKLKIPVQETLIPKGRFTILTDNGADDIDNNPLRIGVTVNGDKKEYYSYIDGETKGKEGKNLYLNITTNRYIETTIEFENPEFATDNIGDIWVRLNKSDYPTGELIGGNINGSLLWGRVKGDVIDIPVKYGDKTYDNLILKVFQENPDGSESRPIELTNSQVNFAIPAEPKKNFIIKYDKGNNFIEFSLDKGYTDTIEHKDIIFYIRYIDGSKEEDKGFLFDQKYIVKFKKKVDYKGDIIVRFKNPSMAKIDNENGVINLYAKNEAGKYLGKNNNDTEKDKIDWVDIGISQATIDKIKTDLIGDNYTLTNIENGNNAKDLIIQLDKDQFKIALPEFNSDFKNIFGTSYDGEEIESSFSLQFANSDEKDSKAYRLNIIIDKFDPKYYGKVFIGTNETDYGEYKELNNVGEGAIDLTETNVKPDNYIYVDLNTSYRDYIRYEALPTTLQGKELKITLPKDVEAIPRNSNYAKPVKGDIVLFNKSTGGYIEDEKTIEFTTDGKNTPENYPLKLRLSLVEYQKLRPYTKYEIYKDGNYNILTIGTDNLEDNMIMDKALNFEAKGPTLKITDGILDFGKIVPENLPDKLNSISGTTNPDADINKNNKREARSIMIEMDKSLDSELGNITRDLELEGDITWIKQLSASGQPMENGGTLKVRDIAVEKSSTTEGTEATNQVITETYDVSGILEVPKNIERSKYGSYEGQIILHYTFY